MTQTPAKQITQAPSLINKFADRFNVDPDKLLNTLKATAFKQSGDTVISNEQMMALLVVADQYKLNPFTKEIYAFPNRGGIQPIVSIDGWLRIINSHKDFDGMEFEDKFVDRALVSVTCRMFRKGRSHPTEVTEYMSECSRATDTWVKYPARMLRHKATIQAARYAFGFSGIVDPDEGERIRDMGAVDVVPINRGQPAALPEYPADHFDEDLKAWTIVVNTDKKSPQDIINMVSSKYTLNLEQTNKILEIKPEAE